MSAVIPRQPEIQNLRQYLENLIQYINDNYATKNNDNINYHIVNSLTTIFNHQDFKKNKKHYCDFLQTHKSMAAKVILILLTDNQNVDTVLKQLLSLRISNFNKQIPKI